MVAGVNEDGPADKAKIHNGDIILRFNGQEVKEMRNLPRIVADTPIGQSVDVVVWRGGKEVTLQAVVGELPDEEQVAAATPGAKPETGKSVELSGLGIKLAPITPQTRDQYSLGSDQKGVVITDVAQDSPAAERGVRPGDVIVEVQQAPVNTPADVKDKVESARKQSRKSVLMLIQGQDGLRWVPLPVTAGDQKKPG
jgi:serine protease Do